VISKYHHVISRINYLEKIGKKATVNWWHLSILTPILVSFVAFERRRFSYSDPLYFFLEPLFSSLLLVDVFGNASVDVN